MQKQTYGTTGSSGVALPKIRNFASLGLSSVSVESIWHDKREELVDELVVELEAVGDWLDESCTNRERRQNKEQHGDGEQR